MAGTVFGLRDVGLDAAVDLWREDLEMEVDLYGYSHSFT